jgi:hypothetical protein
MLKPHHHAFPNASSSKRETALLPNDDVIPTADVFTECFEENLVPNGTLLPNSAHKSVSFLYQFLVLTVREEKMTGVSKGIIELNRKVLKTCVI